jgi:hypothetical protein
MSAEITDTRTLDDVAGLADRREALDETVEGQPHPLLFAVVSGAHLYGFDSPDSDIDLRGVHLLPTRQILGLERDRHATREVMRDTEEMELDLVTHDIEKFLRMLLSKNALVLEQLHAPLVVHTSGRHEELCELARPCITRHHVHHYRGFARSRFESFEAAEVPKLKPLLYTYRALMTGIHLMRTGEVIAHLPTLNEAFGDERVDDLVAQKRASAERAPLPGGDVEGHRARIEELFDELERAHESSSLPESPGGRAALDDFLVRTRLAALDAEP